MLTILFQVVLAALVILSFLLVVGVPFAYASPQYWSQSKPLLYVGFRSLVRVSDFGWCIKLPSGLIQKGN
ncbi:Photosystem II reaction center protein Z [Planktothrix agardhii]|nr:Photosystem II reaction center protein Z [Planktothrix agardhii]